LSGPASSVGGRVKKLNPAVEPSSRTVSKYQNSKVPVAPPVRDPSSHGSTGGDDALSKANAVRGSPNPDTPPDVPAIKLISRTKSRRLNVRMKIPPDESGRPIRSADDEFFILCRFIKGCARAFTRAAGVRSGAAALRVRSWPQKVGTPSPSCDRLSRKTAAVQTLS
jgi:hypothetical protein